MLWKIHVQVNAVIIFRRYIKKRLPHCRDSEADLKLVGFNKKKTPNISSKRH